MYAHGWITNIDLIATYPSMSEHTQRIDKLIDAIEFVKLNQHEKARELLRELIRENNDFEDAWLWLSVVVETLDQSSICLDNVLRINPNNAYAAGALYRIRKTDLLMEKRRSRLRGFRDMSLTLLWVFFLILLFTVLLTYPVQ